MNKKEECVKEIVLVAVKDLAMMSDIICDKYDIPQDDREEVRRGVLKDFIAYGKIAINVVDTLKELNT